MSKFKIGDTVIAKKDVIEIWIKSGKEYEVLGYEIHPATPGIPCSYPISCGHNMHDASPEICFIKIKGEKATYPDGFICYISENCFDLKENT